MTNYRPHVRSHGGHAERVSSALGECVREVVQQPGQGTKWGVVVQTVGRGVSRGQLRLRVSCFHCWMLTGGGHKVVWCSFCIEN